jgi:glycosyltransferase A (GT-A) superfamily protein (DUF2064 family)
VPTHDGGHVLVGQRRPVDARCFRGMTWSHPRVMDEARRRLAASGVRWAELSPVRDVDDPADLASLPPEWRTALHCTAGRAAQEVCDPWRCIRLSPMTGIGRPTARRE